LEGGLVIGGIAVDFSIFNAIASDAIG